MPTKRQRAFLGDRPLTDAWVNDLEPAPDGLRADLAAASHDAHLDAFHGWVNVLERYLSGDLP
ncbi:hypothetical protein OHA10_36730 [Kribbella sp. NBC_00662]|uniref:hypothetical protein n=1 Tax=Kribbella sp. NBC_00662 TaxID=2975969 RepID=UPI00324E5350